MRRENWKYLKFEDAFVDVSKRGKKIPKSNYLSEGRFSIIDQGQNYVTGYSNSSEGLYSDVPALIFGDHTRIIKYVDVPFFLGADGVKLLKSKLSDVDYKFLYYVLSQLHIIDTGYNRHFKYLKEQIIPLPPLDEQKRIADVLDKASELINKRKEQIRLMDQLPKSLFIEMFGDPVENPMGWEPCSLDTVCCLITDGTHQPPKYVERGVPFLFVSNIVNNELVYDTDKYITRDEYEKLIKRTPVEVGDILLTIVGSYGNPAIIRSTKEFCFQRHIAYLKPNQKLISSVYLHSAFLSSFVKNQIEDKVKGVAQKTLNLSELKNVKIIIPPLSLQNEFADHIKAIEQQMALLQEGLSKMETAYKALMQEYFG